MLIGIGAFIVKMTLAKEGVNWEGTLIRGVSRFITIFPWLKNVKKC